MKRKSPLVRNSSETDLNTAMTPMIDVVFLLLVFFVWTASFQIVEYILPSELKPQLGSQSTDPVEAPPPSDFEDIVIKINWNGQSPQWLVDGKPSASVQAVGEKLKMLPDTSVTVIIDPNQSVPLGFVIETYDTVKLSGFNKISFAVTPKKK